MRKLIVSFGRKHPAEITKTAQTSWEKFAEYLAREPAETTDKASVGWFCPAQFKPEYRDSENFVARHALTFDYDDIDFLDVDDIKASYADLAYVMYTTASHTDEKPRIRVVFPLSRPATFDEFCAVTRKIAARFDIEKLARESDTPAQMMFLPSKKPGGVFWSEINEGAWVDVDAVLAEYDDWTDQTQWPRRLRGDSAHHSAGNLTPPDQKPGIVGDFCRAFRVPEAITRFALPYTEGPSEGRYTYTHGSRPDGLRIYDDGLKAHSDHNTDPANGQNNAFDLVRLHKFGKLDSEADLDKPVTERPSYKAMCQLAMEQPELQRARISAEFEDLGDDPEPADNPSAKGAAKDPNRFRVIPAPEFATESRLEWIIKGILPRAELAVVYGESGSGKSFLVLDMCAAVTRGVPWREMTVKPGRVVYVAAEGAKGFRQRLRAYAHKHGVDLAELPGVIGDAPNMLEESDAAAITKSILNWGKTDLVVVDTLAASMPGGDENTGKDMGKLLQHCRFIHRKTGALVVLVHHSGKDASKGARGWSGLKAATDAEIEVTRNGDYRAAVVTKLKDGSDGKVMGFKLQTVVLGVDEDGDEITSCVIEHVDAAPAVEKRPEPQGLYAKTVLRTAREVIDRGDAIDANELARQSAAKLPAAEDGKRDTRRQQCMRAVQKLVADGWLFLHENNTVALTTITPDDESWMED